MKDFGETSEWVTTSAIRALGHDFDVTTIGPLASHIDHVFSALAHPGEATHHYRLGKNGPEAAEKPGRWVLHYGDEELMSSASTGFIYSYLCWHVNRHAITGCTDLLLLHASCAADDDGRAVLLPAVQESGKTTTVAGLVRSGLSYLTDEATALDPVTGMIHPYPKPLSVDKGSWEVLADLRPEIDPAIDGFLGSQWQVPGDQVGTVAEQATPALVVTPTYDADATAEIEPMTPGETLLALGSNAFNLALHGDTGFQTLASIAATCPGYRLRHGDLDAAVAAIRDLLEQA